jgi:hypothetical protein
MRKIKKQKFHRGDVVHVERKYTKEDYPGLMGGPRDHFDTGLGIVVYSYHDQYGGGNVDDYSIYFLGETGESSWYPEEEMELVIKGQHKLLQALLNRDRAMYGEDCE